jgi:hypothetical protein
MLRSVFLLSSIVIRVNMHEYHDFVAEGPLCVQRIIWYCLPVFNNSWHGW